MRKFRLYLTVLALLICAASSFAQRPGMQVSGSVTDVNAEPIAGVAIHLEGNPSVYTMTDTFGAYSIRVPEGGALVISCLGYKTKQVPINGRSVLDIILEMESEDLDEVIVTAQGMTRKQKSVGYAQTQLNGEDLTKTRQTDLGNALAGRIAGARFFGASGATFDEGSIVLRGSTNYTSPTGSEPIYVVDGTITNKASVNMDDVENISVLKGAAATSLYGSNGANGAVIITTKKAKDGRSSVEFSHTFQFEKYYNHYQMQHEYGGGSFGYYGEYLGSSAATAEYYGYSTDTDFMSADFLYGEYAGYVNADGSYYLDYASDESWGARFDKNVKMASALYYDSTSSKYQQADPFVSQLDLADLFRTGYTNTSNVAFSKSGKDYSMRVSFTNTERTGIQQNSKATRRYLSAKMVYSPKKWVDITLDYKYTYRQNHNAAAEGYGTTGNVLYSYIQWGHTEVNLNDYKDYQRPDGSWRSWNITSTTNLTSRFHDNPYAILDNRNVYASNHWNVITGDAQFNLPLNIKAGVKVMANMRNNITERSLGSGADQWTPSYYQYQYKTQDITIQGRLTYSNRFIHDRLTLDAAAFIEQEDYDYRYLYASTSDGLTIDNFYNLSNSAGYVSAENSLTEYKLRSVYGNATVGFDDTYFLDISVRNDWDSRLPNTNNSYLYGGLSASVMMDNFFNAKWLNYWKLRGSIAQVGSTMSAYAVSSYYYLGTNYNNLLTMYESYTKIDQNIKPTISTSYEVGTEFRMFDSRLWGDINLYTRDTKNQILTSPTLGSSGYAYVQKNAGLVNNKGIEIELGGAILKNRNFQWNLDFNIAKNKSCLKYLDDDTDFYTISGNSFYYYGYCKAIVGRPLGVLSTTCRWARDEETGKLLLQSTSSSYYGGGYRYVLDTDEKEVGTMQPDFTGGFSTDFTYRNLTLGLNFDFSAGGYIWSWSNMWGEGSGTAASTSKLNNNGVNVREALVDGGGVYIEGIDATTGEEVSCYMNAYAYYHDKAYYDMDAYFYKRSYLKLREISLTYSVPSKWLKEKLPFVSNASLSFVANNPWLIYSACPNIDPSESSTNWIEGGQAASTRSFGFTLKLGF